MGNIQKTWAEIELKVHNALGTAHGKSGQAGELLKFSDTNRRLNNVPQAQWGAFFEQEYSTFVANSEEAPEGARVLWSFVMDPKICLEKYQLTMTDKEDARNEFLEAKMYEAKAQTSKGKNTLSIESGGSGDTSGND